MGGGSPCSFFKYLWMSCSVSDMVPHAWDGGQRDKVAMVTGMWQNPMKEICREDRKLTLISDPVQKSTQGGPKT